MRLCQAQCTVRDVREEDKIMRQLTKYYQVNRLRYGTGHVVLTQ